MATVNETLADEVVAHAVHLSRYSNGVVRRIIGILNKTDSDLIATLTGTLERLPAESFTVSRLERLLKSVRELNLTAYRHVEKELTEELRKFAAVEANYQLELFKSAIPAQVIASVGVAAVDVEQVYTAALSRPFQGRLLKEWASTIEAGRMTRIRDAVRMGYIEGQSIDEIVRRLRGTRAKGYSDGIIEIDRRHAEAVVRTAVSHTAGVTRNRFYEDNTDLLAALGWASTLDSKTSEPCRLRDGLKYDPVTHKPIGHRIPWLSGPGMIHWCCRSISIPVTKSWKDLGIDMEEFSPSTRASMDGQVPAQTTYSEWLKNQSVKRQDDILGPQRGKMLRDGDLTLDRFYSDKGRYLSLDELAARGIE